MESRSFALKTRQQYDVIVIGGGTTGIAASIAAARHGARTAIVESLAFLGGNAANLPGWLGFHNLQGQQVIRGIAWEIIEKLRTVGGATKTYLDPITSSVTGVNGSWLKIIATQQVDADDVDVWLQTLAVDVATRQQDDRKHAEGVYVFNREGLHYYEAKVIVDCTDSGEIARMAGARMVRGRAGDHKVQVSSWTVTVGNVDFEKLMAYFVKNPDQIRPFPLKDPEALLDQMHDAEVFVMGSFNRLIQKAKANGLNLPRDFFPGSAFPKLGDVMTVASRVENVDPNDAANNAQAQIEGMRQTQLWMKFLHEYVPGFENCRLITTPSHIGIRESSHMVGEYTLTGEDLMAGQRFEDVIALGGYHLDIHTPDHPGLETQRPPTYQIPYRSLLPKGVDGLLVAGRAISATHEAQSSTRVIPISMAQGQAAGTAAAMAAKHGIEPRDVDVKELQRMLIADGCELGQNLGIFSIEER
jgi:ribulose 1,5-bisphosphate synthetase/thiazole synthase